ncbi:FUSC family protein [Klebsiella variicola]
MENDNCYFLRLWQDLLPYPGRKNQVCRTVLASILVVIISQMLQIPWLALSLITVFFVSQTNVVLTRLTGMLFLVGTTFAVSLSLLMLQVTWNVPLLRIVIASAIFLVSVFLMRTSPLYGAVFFVVALVVIYSQSLVDISADAEQVVRNILWVCVSVNYAICITMIINTLLLPSEPIMQLKRLIHSQIDSIIQRLGSAQPPSQKEISQAGREMQSMYLLLRYAAMRNSAYCQQHAWYMLMVSTLADLRTLACHLPMKVEMPIADKLAADAIKKYCLDIYDAIYHDKPEMSSEAINVCAKNEVLNRMVHVLNEYSKNIKSGLYPPETKSIRFLLPDALNNSQYKVFALKTLFSVLICYLIYTAVDWPGIHTIMLSCLIVAQPGLGNIQRKIILRLLGATIGGMFALISVVYILPHLDTIFGLLMLVIPVLIGSAWIANGSENISYAGVQIMFTFSMAILETFSPVYEVTEIRDRLVGIIAGIIIAGIVHVFINPEREGGVLLNRLADLINKSKTNLSCNGRVKNKYSSIIKSLAECETLANSVMLEPNWNSSEGFNYALNQKINSLLRNVGNIIFITNDLELISAQIPGKYREHTCNVLQACGNELDNVCQWLRGEKRMLVIENVVVPGFLPDFFRYKVEELVTCLKQVTLNDSLSKCS